MLITSNVLPGFISQLNVKLRRAVLIGFLLLTVLTLPPTAKAAIFDFSLAASPSTLSITPGAAGGVETAIANLAAGATTTPITFTILTPLPSGVTTSAFTNNPCSPTCSATATLTASATAPSSSTVITIQGSGGSPVVTHNATFTLVVSPPSGFDFGLAVSPSTLSVIHGEASGGEVVSTTLLAGISTPVTFSITTPLPTGVVAYPFSPASCTPSCSTSVTLTALAIAPPSTTTLTIQAVGGGVTKTATFIFVVTCDTPGSIDFCVKASPSTLTIVPGGPIGVETVSANLLGGTTTPVTFSIDTVLPVGVTASAFVPSSCTPTCSTTVNLTASPNAPASTTIVYFRGTGGGVISPGNFTLVVQKCACQLNLTASPTTLTIVPGNVGQTETVTAMLVAGVAPPVTFSVTTPLPIGVSASAFTPVSCTPTCTASFILTASATAPGSNTTLTIQATGGGITSTTTFILEVTCGSAGPFDLCLSTTPSNVTIVPGGPSAIETVTATLLAGSPTPVTFGISTPLPPGVTASAFTPTSCSPTCFATVNLTASPSAPFDTFTVVTVSASGGGITKTATFTLFVAQFNFFFSVSAIPATLTIAPGAAGGVETATATLNAGATTSPVTFSILTTLPSGVTASAFTNSPCSPTCSATITLTASGTAPASSTVITIQASGGTPTVTHTATFTLVVSGFFDFALAASPSTLSITQGGAGGVETATATLATGAMTASVTLSILTTLPTGVTASAFSNSPCSPTCSATVAFTATCGAPASSTVITIQASGGSPVVTHTATFTLVVSGFFDLALAASPSTLSVTPGALGGVETVTATSVGSCGGTSPFTFSILTALPVGVTASAFNNSPCLPTCSATVTFSASMTAPASSTVVTIQASGGSPTVTHTATFTLVVSGFFDFTLAASPSTLTITDGAAGGVETATATLSAGGVTSPVTFTILTALPSGVTASAFTNNPCSPTCSAMVTFTASSTAPLSSTVVTIQASGGSPLVTRNATFTLVVGQCCFITLALSPATLTITPGVAGGIETAIATITSGTTSPVTFGILTTLPTGVTASTFTNSPCSPTCSATVTFTASPSAPQSTTVITIQETGGSPAQTHTATFTLNVRLPGDSDGDGIPDNMDCGVVGFSNCFNDFPLGGTTSGTILSRGDQCPAIPCQLTFAEVSPSVGILITSGSASGLTPASISVCSGSSVFSVSANTQLTVKCGSVTITVISGIVDITFVGSGSQAGVTGAATIIAGNSVTFDPTTFSFTTPASNTTPLVVTISGQTLTVGPGQSASSPFPQFVISVVSPKGEVFAAGAVLKFDGKASFATVGPITKFIWNFGDGTIDTHNVAKLTHTYTTAAKYTVTLTVTDNFGKSNSQSQTIDVLPAPLIGSVTFSPNLFVSGDRLTQNVTIQVTNPNSYPLLVNIAVAGNCDTACPFNANSGPVLVGAGQTVLVNVAHIFSPLDQGLTFNMQVILSFTADTSNQNINTYDLAATQTFQFTIK